MKSFLLGLLTFLFCASIWAFSFYCSGYSFDHRCKEFGEGVFVAGLTSTVIAVWVAVINSDKAKK